VFGALDGNLGVVILAAVLLVLSVYKIRQKRALRQR